MNTQKSGVISIDQNLLKWIAMISMAIDHTGMVLFPQCMVMRMIGRLAFPIYCYLLVKGFIHTRSRGRYMGRMAVFALLSELPFDLACDGRFTWEGQNVFLTLFLALGMLSVLEVLLTDTGISKTLRVTGMVLIVLAAGLLSFACNCDYSFSAPFLVAGLYVYETGSRTGIRIMRYPVYSFLIFFVTMYVGWLMNGLTSEQAYAGVILEAYCLPAAWLIRFCNGTRKKTGGKYFFYAFYPLHLLLLYFLGRLYF